MTTTDQKDTKTNQYYSQFGQDKYAIENIFCGKRNGYFVDVGAYNGIDYSNTYTFEKYYGWKGVCVEVLPEMYKKCVEVRPGSICFDCAAYSSEGEQTFVGADMLSGILKDIDGIAYKDMINTSVSEGKLQTIKVKTRTLTSILDEAKAPSYIDYMSIDVEGGEFEVLKGIDFKKYSFGFISLEHNYAHERSQLTTHMLEKAGYLFHGRRKVDDEYISPMLRQTLLKKHDDMQDDFVDEIVQSMESSGLHVTNAPTLPLPLTTNMPNGIVQSSTTISINCDMLNPLFSDDIVAYQ